MNITRLLPVATIALTAWFSSNAHADELGTLLAQCAPTVHPYTMRKLITVESNGRMFAVSDDGPSGMPWQQRKKMLRSYNASSYDEAVQIAYQLQASGHLFGLGLAQVSSRNLPAFGISIAQALVPCTNLAVGSRLLTRFYLNAQASDPYPDAQRDLISAISAYNTGSFTAGITNGYVQKVEMAGEAVVPAMVVSRDREREITPQRVERAPAELLSSKFAVLNITPE